MKVFFDTNVYVAEALLGHAAEDMIAATCKAHWRIFVGQHVLDEVVSVFMNQKECSFRFASLTCQRIVRRSICVELPASRHQVPDDERDSPILQAAFAASVDYLITNDRHLLSLDPYEGLRIVSMTDYYQLLREQGLLSADR